MYGWIGLGLASVLAVLLATRFWVGLSRTTSIPAESDIIHDPVLGEVERRRSGTNERGSFFSLSCQAIVDGEVCRFTCDYCETEDANGQEAVDKLRVCIALARDEQMRKVLRNSLLQLVGVQQTLNPQATINDRTLISTSKLGYVRLLGDSAHFAYRSNLARHTMTVVVDLSGDVTFVGIS